MYLRNVLFNDAAASQTVRRPMMVSKEQTVKDLKQAARPLIWGDIPVMGLRKTTKIISSLRGLFWFEPGTSLNREVHS